MVLVMVIGCVMSAMGQINLFSDYYAKSLKNDPEVSALISRAMKGDARAQYEWGNIDMTKSVVKNELLPVGALLNYSKAANQNLPEAQVALGDWELNYNDIKVKCYNDKSINVTTDRQKAKEWYQKAANQGFALAQQRLNELFGGNNNINTNQLATINFLSPTSTSSTSYNLQAGIKSSSKITNVSVTVNRGIHSVNNDGYDFTLNKTLTLNPGNNTITVSVANGAGTTTKTLTVYVQSSPTEKKVALVIGNARYRNSPLENPANDANDVAARLRNLGFEVILKTDLTNNGFKTTIDNFRYKTNNCDVALLFYAGHGMEIDSKNYLIPVDASSICENNQLKNESVDADYILNAMSGANKKIVILDACRNNPCRSILHSPGFTKMNSPNSFFIYSTSSGSSAQDLGNNKRNSPFTEAFLSALNYKNLKLEELFYRISNSVQNAQKPDHSSTMPYGVDFIFNK